jgi:hypothetical protein
MAIDVVGSRLVSGGSRLPFGAVKLTPYSGQPVTVDLAADPTYDPAIGGWATSLRFGRTPSRWWQGPQGDSVITLPVAIDSRIALERLQPQVRRDRVAYVRSTIDALHRMGVPTAGSGEPPTIEVQCPSLPLIGAATWLLDAMPSGAQVVTDGVLVRQELTLTLTQYVAVQSVQRTSAKATRSTTNHRRTRTIQSRPGDTIRAIAVRQLGDAGRWKDIRGWNKSLRKTDPDERLRTGTIVVLK